MPQRDLAVAHKQAGQKAMHERELKLTLEFESEPVDTPAAKAEMLEECRSLTELINDYVVPAKIAEARETRPGEKGVPLVIGGILMEAATAGVAKALLDCISAWVGARKREFTFRFEKGGVKFEFQSSNLNNEQIAILVAKLSDVVSS